MTSIFTESELDELFGPLSLYGTDKHILINGGNTDDEFCEKLEQYCRDNDYVWDYSDSVVEDYETGHAYQCDVFGNYTDVIMCECEWLGRFGFEDGTYDWYTISDEFINQSSRALPEWFPTEQLESDGFELQSCDFANGWYGRQDDPKATLAKAKANNFDLVFQINYYHQFECSFCVWKRSKHAN